MEDRRGLGWDIDSGFSSPRGQHFPLGSYGHTGFTGHGFLDRPLFANLFSSSFPNRVHPDGKGSVVPALPSGRDAGGSGGGGF